MSVIRREIRRVVHRRKHHSEEARKEAKREAARKYYRKHREEILRKARERRGMGERSRAPRGFKTYGPMFIGPLREHNRRRVRKERSNKGVPRPHRRKVRE